MSSTQELEIRSNELHEDPISRVVSTHSINAIGSMGRAHERIDQRTEEEESNVSLSFPLPNENAKQQKNVENFTPGLNRGDESTASLIDEKTQESDTESNISGKESIHSLQKTASKRSGMGGRLSRNDTSATYDSRDRFVAVVPIKPKLGRLACFCRFKHLKYLFCCCCLCWTAIKRQIEEQYFITKEAILKMLVLSFTLCRFKEAPFEVNVSETVIVATFFLAICAHIAIIAIWCISFFYEDEFLWETFIPVGVSLLMSVINAACCLCGFAFKLRRLYMVMIIGVGMDWIFISSAVFSNQYFRGHSFIGVWLLPVLFIFSTDYNYKLCSTIFYFVLIFAAVLYQVIRSMVEYETIEVGPIEQLHMLLINFIIVLVASFFTLFFQYVSYSKLKSFQKKVTKIGTAITKLDFEAEDVKTLMETPNKICTSHSLLLKRIVLNVKEYKTYLPQGLVMDEAEASEMQQASQNESSKMKANQRRHDDSDHSSISSSQHSGSRSSAHQSENKSVDSIEMEKSKDSRYRRKRKRVKNRFQLMTNNLIDYSLQNRYGTIVLFDVNGWNEIMEENKVELFVSYYTRFVEIICEEVKKKRGMIISLMNDKVVAGWNIKNIVVNHEVEATIAVSEVFRRLKGDIRLPIRVPVKTSIVTGNVTVGNMGCSQIKSFNFFGRKINSLYSLNKYAKIDGGFCLLVDQRTREKIKFGFKTLFINCVKCKERKFRIYKVMERNHKSEISNEWLYQIDKSHLEKEGVDDFGSNDLYFLGEKLEEEYSRGDYQKAEHFLAEINKQVKLRLFKDLAQNIKLKKPYSVLD